MIAPRAATDLADVRELVEVTLQGAEANERPDLVERLTKAAAPLSSSPVAAAAVRSAAGHVVEALQSLEIDLWARQAMVCDPGRAARLLAEMRHAERRLRDFKDGSAQWPQVLGDELSVASSDLEFHIRDRVRLVLEEGNAAIESGDAAGAGFEVWLRERLVAETDATYERLRAAVDVMACRLAARLEMAPPAPVAGLPVTPPATLVATLATRARGRATRSPLSGRLLGVVMPTYGGTMMALVLPHFLGLPLHGLSLAVCAVAGAFTMGGAAVAAERQRQRGRRNGETLAVLRSTLDAFQLALVKQVRDGARELQTSLRRDVGAAVAQRRRLLEAEANGARRAAEDTRRAADAVRDIGEDLASIGELRRRALQVAHLDTAKMVQGRAETADG